jgi:hypothetical protein
MSLKRIVKGKIFITDLLLAQEILKKYPGIAVIENHHFTGRTNGFLAPALESNIQSIENEYRLRLEEKQRKLEEERIRLERERAKLEEEKRLVSNQEEILRQLIELEKQQQANKKEISQQQEEAKKVEPEIQKYRQERLDRITANAVKKGYVIKKKIVENNKVKLILQRREA